MRAVPGADIFKLRFKPDINLDRVGEILDKLQVCTINGFPLILWLILSLKGAGGPFSIRRTQLRSIF